MRTKEIRADRLSVTHHLVEQDIGPRGGEGRRVGRKISEVRVLDGSVYVRVRVDGEMESRPVKGEPSHPFKASDRVRIVA